MSARRSSSAKGPRSAPTPPPAPPAPAGLRARARLALLGDGSRSLRAALRAELRRPVRVRLRDKVAFTIGVVNLLITEALLLRAPTLLPQWYTAWAVPLLAWRWVSFRRKKWGYFLADFCYAVNLLVVAHLWLAPADPLLFQLAFACACGPLAWAVLAWRNSLVFHDLEKTTSLFIHLMPALVMYTRRWQHGAEEGALPAYLAAGGSGAAGSPASYARHLSIPLLAYVCWQGAYLLKTELLDAHHLRDPAQQTSLRYMTRVEAAGLPALTHAVCVWLRVMSRGERWDPDTLKTKVIFMVVQFLYTVITLLPTALMMDHHWAALAFAALWGAAAVWNGASFYVEVFSRHYIRDLELAMQPLPPMAPLAAQGAGLGEAPAAASAQAAASSPRRRGRSPRGPPAARREEGGGLLPAAGAAEANAGDGGGSRSSGGGSDSSSEGGALRSVAAAARHLGDLAQGFGALADGGVASPLVSGEEGGRSGGRRARRR